MTVEVKSEFDPQKPTNLKTALVFLARYKWNRLTDPQRAAAKALLASTPLTDAVEAVVGRSLEGQKLNNWGIASRVGLVVLNCFGGQFKLARAAGRIISVAQTTKALESLVFPTKFSD